MRACGGKWYYVTVVSEPPPACGLTSLTTTPTPLREKIDEINKSATEEFLFSTLSDSSSPYNKADEVASNPVPGAAATTTPLPPHQPNNIDTIHASIAKSIASRFEESIKERIKQRSMYEVKAIEAAVRNALEGLELDGEMKSKKKKKRNGKGAQRLPPRRAPRGATGGAEVENVTRLKRRRNRIVNP